MSEEKLKLNALCIVCGGENTDMDDGSDWWAVYLEGREVDLYCRDCDKFTTTVTYSSPEIDSKTRYVKYEHRMVTKECGCSSWELVEVKDED